MENKLTPQQRKFVDALFSEDIKGNVSAAARAAGYPSSPHISEDMRKEIIDRASAMIASEAPKAVYALSGILDDPEKALGGAAMLKAATELLDRGGLSKVDRVQVSGLENSLVFLPSKKPVVEE